MGERVRRYELGEVILEGDREALVGALSRMMQAGYYQELSGRARWQDYREAHSTQRLNDVFGELIKHIEAKRCSFIIK